MQTKIILFGQIIDIAGQKELTLEDVLDTDELVMILHEKYPLLKNLEYRIAVNKDIILNNTSLDDQSTVALLPPFSGG